MGWFFRGGYTFFTFFIFDRVGVARVQLCVRVSFKNSNDEVRNSHLIFFLSAGC